MQPETFATALLDWYSGRKRDLPWRAPPWAGNPYAILVSEVMLQQTQVDRVVGYFDRFLARFPTPRHLAEAPEEDLLKLWEGLGYYSRARNLQKAARAIVAVHGGRLPDTEAELLALPGVGPYTAGAVASIAFDRDCPAVDANVERVLARVLNLDQPLSAPSVKARLREAARKLIPPGRACDFNQALMELGALVCSPRAPDCRACPVATLCEAARLGVQEVRPVKKKSSAPGASLKKVEWGAGALFFGSRLLVRKRPEGVIMGGLWELPGAMARPGESAREAAARAFREDFGLNVVPGQILASARHGFTSHDCRLSVYLCRAKQAAPPPSGTFAVEIRLIRPEELAGLALSAGHRKALPEFLAALRMLAG